MWAKASQPDQWENCNTPGFFYRGHISKRNARLNVAARRPIRGLNMGIGGLTSVQHTTAGRASRMFVVTAALTIVTGVGRWMTLIANKVAVAFREVIDDQFWG
jgi:hypothetical protein